MSLVLNDLECHLGLLGTTNNANCNGGGSVSSTLVGLGIDTNCQSALGTSFLLVAYDSSYDKA